MSKGRVLDYPEHQDWPAIFSALERDGSEGVWNWRLKSSVPAGPGVAFLDEGKRAAAGKEEFITL
jgi:hypothetical protein